MSFAQQIMCGKCGKPVAEKDIMQRGFHRIGKAHFTRIFYTCPSCRRHGQILLKAERTGAKFPSQP